MDFSFLSLGFWRLNSWNYSPAQISELVHHCIDLGITTFDHADIYGGYTCEEIFGKALAEQHHIRQKIQLVSKCGIKLVSPLRPRHKSKSYDTSKDHIILSVENSLKALQTDYLDLLLIHRPNPFMDPDDTAKAFSTLRQQGKVLHFGVSNFMPSQFDLLQSRLSFPLVTNQVEVSVLYTEPFNNGILDHALIHQYRPMAWSPLVGGRLCDENNHQVMQLRNLMKEIGGEAFTVEQVAIAWLLAHPARMVPVLGTGRKERISQAAQAARFQMTSDQWLAIYVAATGTELP